MHCFGHKTQLRTIERFCRHIPFRCEDTVSPTYLVYSVQVVLNAGLEVEEQLHNVRLVLGHRRLAVQVIGVVQEKVGHLQAF